MPVSHRCERYFFRCRPEAGKCTERAESGRFPSPAGSFIVPGCMGGGVDIDAGAAGEFTSPMKKISDLEFTHEVENRLKILFSCSGCVCVSA